MGWLINYQIYSKIFLPIQKKKNFFSLNHIDQLLKNDISEDQVNYFDNVASIVLNKECFENILFCLDIKQEILSKLLKNYNKSNSLDEIIQYLESITVTIR